MMAGESAPRQRKRKWDLAADDGENGDAQSKPGQQAAADQAALAAQKISQMIEQKQKAQQQQSQAAYPGASDSGDLDPLSFLQSAVQAVPVSSRSGSTTSVRGPTPNGFDIEAQAAQAQATASAQSVQKFKSKFQDMTQECKQENDTTWVQIMDINDQRNRYVVTKSDNQKQICKDCGVTITNRGKYYPDRNLATEKDPPLHLRLVGPTEESVQKACKRIKDLLSQTITLNAPIQYERPQHQPRKILEEKVPIGLDPIIGFPLRGKIVGPQGAYIKHITGETQSRIQLKGRGSGFKELDGMESSEPLYAHITCPSEEGMEKAKNLFQDLLTTVRAEYERFRASNPYATGGYGVPGAMPYGAPNPYAMMYGGMHPGQPGAGAPGMGYYGHQAPYYGGMTAQPPLPPSAPAPPPPPDEDAPPPPPPPEDGSGTAPPPPPPENTDSASVAPPPPSEPSAAPQAQQPQQNGYGSYDPYGYYAQYYSQYYGYDYTQQQQQQHQTQPPQPPPPQSTDAPPPPPPPE